jgi:hypothetical protein
MSIPVTTLVFTNPHDAKACLTHLGVVLECAYHDNVKSTSIKGHKLTINYRRDASGDLYFDYNATIKSRAESFHAGVEYARRFRNPRGFAFEIASGLNTGK